MYRDSLMGPIYWPNSADSSQSSVATCTGQFVRLYQQNIVFGSVTYIRLWLANTNQNIIQQLVCSKLASGYSGLKVVLQVELPHKITMSHFLTMTQFQLHLISFNSNSHSNSA